MELLLPVLASIALSAFAGFVFLRLWRGRLTGISIRMQVFVAMAAVSGAFAALLGLVAVQRVESRSALLAEETVREDADLLARVLAAAGRPLPEVAPALSRSAPAGLRVEILDEQGTLILGAGPGRGRSVHAQAEIRAGGRRLGTVRVARATLGLRAILRDMAARAAVISLILVFGTACAAALVGRAIAKPIERLTGAASRIAHGERQAVLPRPVGREVRTLTAAVESMRRELEGRHLAERLATDLSHQLKNPVAAIRASAEVLADGALEEPEAARRFVEQILLATERVQGLVNNLLALTRVLARGVEPELVDLAELARLSADAHAAQARRRGVRIETRLGAGAPATIVRGDKAWLRRAIDNLVDNALAFATPRPAEPAEVGIALRSAPEQVDLEVDNAGPGIAAEVRDRLFERFVTTRKETGGSGLGLAIVAAVAEQHGGGVEVVELGPPRTRFRLTLPRASATLHQIFP